MQFNGALQVINDAATRNVSGLATNTDCKTEYPSGVDKSLMEEEECRNLWVKAKNIMSKQDKIIREKFEATHRIMMNNKYCYREELFTEKGWCNIAPSSPNGRQPQNKWGFCSPSCRIAFMKVTDFFTYIIIIKDITYL